MMKYIIPIFFVAFTCQALWASDHFIISGVVLDAETKDPLIGALVTIGDEHTTTNDIGFFTITELEAASATITISYIGYEPISQEVKATGSTQRFFMQASAVLLPAVQIRPNLIDNKQLVNELDIHIRQVDNAQLLLQFVPGLFIAQHAGGGKAEQIFLRGFDIDHGTDVAISVDGIPVNMVSHAHGQGYADLHFVMPELIEDIEYHKGLYDPAVGNFGTAGAVQFKLRNTLPEQFVKVEAGQFSSYRPAFGLNILGQQPSSRQSAYVASAVEFSDGYFESSQNFFRANTFAKYVNKVSDTERFELSASFFTSEWDASGQIPDRAVEQGLISRFGAIDDTEGGQTNRTNLQLEHYKMLDAKTFLHNQVYYSNYNFELYSNFTFFLRDEENGDQIRQKENRHLFGWNARLNNDHRLFQMPASLEAGLQLRTDMVNDNELSYSQNRTGTLEQVSLGDIREANMAAYLSENIQIIEGLQLNLGLRYDAFRFQYEDEIVPEYAPVATTKGIVSPKAGLFYKMHPSLQLQLQGGWGFHSNDTRTVLSDDTQGILARARGAEFTAIWQPQTKWLVTSSFWRLALEDELIYVGDEGIVESAGETLRQGVELSLRYQPWTFMQLDVDATYALPRAVGEPEGDDYLPLAPIFTCTGGIQLMTRSGFSGNLRYRYLADRPANEDYSITAEGYFLLDASVLYRYKNVELGMTVQNLLNTEWKEAQFETTSRLSGESEPATEIHFTPGVPFFLRGQVTYYF
jgi:outer membrane receptor protein involved in Fe transport